MRQRLETASGAFGAITYDYDSIGNLLSRDAVGDPDPGVMDLFYEGGTSPLVERVETTPEGQSTIIHNVTHDAMGNILDDGASRYFWDPRPIMRFHKKGGTSGYYRYSDYTADGIMCARRAYTVDPVVHYAQMVTLDLPGGQRLSERLWDMNFTVFDGRELVWLGDQLVATFDTAASDPGYVFTDHIGYPLMVMDSSANPLWSAVHEPYGEAVLTGGTTADDPLLRYPGQWKDDPAFVVTDPPQRNLFANGYRWYNPDWGRYTQSDPMGNLIEQLFRRRHLYVYAENNPLALIDPQGLDVHNNCPKPICIKPEKEPGPVVLQPGETHEGPVDGVSNMDGEIIKITDPYNDSDIEVGPDGVNLPGPDFFNYMLGGGKLDCPPDAGWKPIFECAKGKE